MKMIKNLTAAMALSVAATAAMAGQQVELAGIGNKIAEDDLVLWNIDVRAYETNAAAMPAGQGNIADGEELYQAQCAMCHGEFGEGVKGYPVLVGGVDEEGTLKSDDPIRTFGSYWGGAPGLFDYIKRAMPFFAPQSLNNDQVYSIVGYIMSMNGLEGVEDETVINGEFLASYTMPNRNGFFTDDRPDVKTKRCMKNCMDMEQDGLVVKGKAIVGDVGKGKVE